jgi:hypothetical protein
MKRRLVTFIFAFFPWKKTKIEEAVFWVLAP